MIKHKTSSIFVSVFIFIMLNIFISKFQPLQALNESFSASVSGRVIDSSTDEPLPGATISIPGTNLGISTDLDGHFSIDQIPYASRVRIRVSYLGYRTETYEVNPLTDGFVEFSLEPDYLLLDQITVTGYVQTKRSARTSAISKIESHQLQGISGSSLAEQAQGQISGLQISSTYGVPGSANHIRLRGTTSINAGNNPLYVVDGVYINSDPLQALHVGGQTINPLADINPSDIESIEVLKDANATAVFGARGANGVIIINTRRGVRDTPTRINFSSEYGISNIVKLWNIASGPEHAQVINEAWVNDGNPFDTRPYRPVSEGGRGNPDDQLTYDRLSPLLRTAGQQTYNLSFSGGDAQTSYFLSGDYTYQEATLRLFDFERLSFRANLDHTISNRLKVGLSSSYSKTQRELVRAGDTGGILNTGIQDASLLPMFNEDGTDAQLGRFNNPYVLLQNNFHNTFGKHLIANTFLQWNILNNLSLKSSWSLDDNDYFESVYYNAYRREGISANGSATDITTGKQTWTAEQVLNYLEIFNRVHFISVFLGNTLQKTDFNRVRIDGRNFPSPEFTRITSAAVTSGTSVGSSSALISYFGGINYNFDNKYSVDFNIRSDASSRFGANNRWATFPSGGFAWQLSEEPFVKNIAPWINELKIKSSIGWTGNQEINDFASLGVWEGGQNYLGLPGIAPYQLGNNDLKWETTRQFNAGFEATAFKNRLAVEFNYYDKLTSDLLLLVPVPIKTGFEATLQNFGELSNKGYELEVSTVNVENPGFRWTSAFNISQNRNIVTRLAAPFSQYNRNWVRLEEGYPLHSFWLYKQLYVDPQTGDAVYEDVNGDGRITSDDRQIVGDAWPKFFGGLRNNLSYRNFDLSAFVYFSYGNKVFNMNRYFQENGGQRGTNWSMGGLINERWQNPGDITDIPRSFTLANADGSYNHNFESSRFLEDGSFIRLRHVSLSYNIATEKLQSFKVQRIRLYVNATNLFTITNYTGPDPEVNTAANFSNGTVQGLDFSVPPQPRTFIFGINVTI
jgi:TonB-dependent starch-binding outer membrane protein SusC